MTQSNGEWTVLRFLSVAMVLLAWASEATVAQVNAAAPVNGCGEVITVATHTGSTTRYTLARAPSGSAQDAGVALVLLVGGGGAIKLDARGCPQALSRNVLIRMQPLFHDAGLVTALVDAPSDASGGDGLAGLRVTPQHADDLGKVINDVRTRTHKSVWLVGHSRGTISAANAAARLAAPFAPDGLVLMSAMMSGNANPRKTLAAQSVFDLPLQAIAVPVLVVGPGADNCMRSPAERMGDITARTKGVRQQLVTITGGPISPGRPASLAACEVQQPHDYVDQESEAAAAVMRFIRGASD